MKQTIVTTNDNISANNIANQMPFMPNINGNKNIIATWNTKVLKKDIKAEIKPLFKAVKNDEAKTLIPPTKYDNTYKRIAMVVRFNKSSL